MAERGYFSHDMGSRNDRKLVKLLMKEGIAGIGIFWCLVEMLNEEAGTIMLHECERIAFELRTDEGCIARVIKDYELFENDGQKFWSESVIKRMELRQDKSKKARNSANKRWKDANALRTQSEGNAIKERKEKEIKVNQIKENINQVGVFSKNEIQSNESENEPIGWVEDLANTFLEFFPESETRGRIESALRLNAITLKQSGEIKKAIPAYFAYKKHTGEKIHSVKSFLSGEEWLTDWSLKLVEAKTRENATQRTAEGKNGKIARYDVPENMDYTKTDWD